MNFFILFLPFLFNFSFALNNTNYNNTNLISKKPTYLEYKCFEPYHNCINRTKDLCHCINSLGYCMKDEHILSGHVLQDLTNQCEELNCHLCIWNQTFYFFAPWSWHKHYSDAIDYPAIYNFFWDIWYLFYTFLILIIAKICDCVCSSENNIEIKIHNSNTPNTTIENNTNYTDRHLK